MHTTKGIDAISMERAVWKENEDRMKMKMSSKKLSRQTLGGKRSPDDFCIRRWVPGQVQANDLPYWISLTKIAKFDWLGNSF